MGELPGAVRRTTDALDALGNTTAATGKGFAIGSAVLTALSLLNAFEDRVTDTTALNLSVNDSIVLAGIVFGSMLPFLFGALTMISVGLSAQDLMGNVRDQFMKKREVEYKMNGKSLSEITKNDSDVQKILWTKKIYDSKSNEYYQRHYTEEERAADPRFFVKPDGIDLRWVFDSCVTDLVGGKAVQVHNTTAVHHQWKEMRTKGVGNKSDGWKPDSAQCIAISTSSSI